MIEGTRVRVIDSSLKTFMQTGRLDGQHMRAKASKVDRQFRVVMDDDSKKRWFIAEELEVIGFPMTGYWTIKQAI
jgi:hypothetical protein